jgi:hypothetical protein
MWGWEERNFQLWSGAGNYPILIYTFASYAPEPECARLM